MAHGIPPGLHLDVFASFQDVLRAFDDSWIAVDVPIGLLDGPRCSARPCDKSARKVLGPRRSSVFNPPSRAVLKLETYTEARMHGLSVQAFHLIPRIREVDALLKPSDQNRIREAHPEVGFYRLLGQPLPYPKRDPAGAQLRRALLERAFQAPLPAIIPRGAREDDALDALVLLLTAQRMARGEQECLPQAPDRDARGLRMEMVF